MKLWRPILCMNSPGFTLEQSLVRRNEISEPFSRGNGYSTISLLIAPFVEWRNWILFTKGASNESTETYTANNIMAGSEGLVSPDLKILNWGVQKSVSSNKNLGLHLDNFSDETTSCTKPSSSTILSSSNWFFKLDPWARTLPASLTLVFQHTAQMVSAEWSLPFVNPHAKPKFVRLCRQDQRYLRQQVINNY